MSVFYPLWYRSYRLQIKDIINTDTNSAKSLLDSTVTEHDSTLSSNDPDENNRLHHAKEHLDSFVNTNQDPQKQVTLKVLDEENRVSES